MRTLLALAGLAALLYGLVCLAFLLGQRAFIYFPVATRDASVPVMRLHRDGVELLVSVHPARSAHAVVYFGGNAEDVSRAVPGLRAAFGGAAIYALHYRGYGGSGGAPSERELVGDGAALVAQVAARHPRLTLVGRSLGSGVAMQVARRYPPRALVLVTPFDSLVAVARHHYRWLPVRLLMRERFDSAAHAGAIGVPTTLIVASADRVVPPARAAALAAAFSPGVARALVLDGVGHNDVDAHPGYAAALRGATH